MARNGLRNDEQRWICAIEKRAGARRQYAAIRLDPRRLERKRASWRRADEKRRQDPRVALDRQFRDAMRVRVI